jgi:hypothetical protein
MSKKQNGSKMFCSPSWRSKTALSLLLTASAKGVQALLTPIINFVQQRLFLHHKHQSQSLEYAFSFLSKYYPKIKIDFKIKL